MSAHNLIELSTRAARAGVAPSPLDLLKGAVREHGSLCDEDLRAAAAASGLPEATVYGVATFYDELAQPRGARHVSACSGTACWAAGAAAQLARLEAGLGVRVGERSPDGACSLAATACLGFCHAGPAFREGDLVDGGVGALERVLAGRTRQAAAPAARSTLAEPVLLRPGDYTGLRHVLARRSPQDLLEQVVQARLRGRGGAGFPAGSKWEFVRRAASGPKVVVVNADEGDPGSYIDKYLLEQNPALLLEGLLLAGYATGASRGFVYVRSEYPRAAAALAEAIAAATDEGLIGEDVLGSGFAFAVTVVEGAGSYVVGEETALLSSLQGLRGVVSARPPFPAESGYHGLPTLVNNVETLCNVPFIARYGAAAYAALSPGATPGSKLVCLNERFTRPGVYEIPFGLPLRTICEDLGGGLRRGALKALQIGGPLGGLLPAGRLDTPFDFAPLAAEGCMLGHGSIVGFDEQTDMRGLARHLLAFGAGESCGKCFPCRIGLQRALELVEADGPIPRAPLEELLETLELASLCGHGSGMPAPLRSLIAHFPAELGLVP